MKDAQLHERIEQLVAKEHELYERAAEGGLSERAPPVGRNQGRPRPVLGSAPPASRAARSGSDPNAARVRDPEVVERYEQ
jgi:hypothetical protein